MMTLPYLPAVALTLALAMVPTPSAGEVFKCASSPGKVEYRDYACDPSAIAERVDTRANTIGTGETLESIRARNDSMTRRLDARRAADEHAFERDREARDWVLYQDRAYRDRDDSGYYGYGDGAYYWPGYVTPRMRKHAVPTPPRTRVAPPAIVTRKKG